MLLEKELMEKEFIHGFGMGLAGLRANLHTLNQATSKHSTNRIPKEKFYRRLSNFLEISCSLAKLIQTTERKGEKQSILFSLIKTCNNSLQKYTNHLSGLMIDISKEYYKRFDPYRPSLEEATEIVKRLGIISKLYDETVDGYVARINWVEKNPEWVRGDWRLLINSSSRIQLLNLLGYLNHLFSRIYFYRQFILKIPEIDFSLVSFSQPFSNVLVADTVFIFD